MRTSYALASQQTSDTFGGNAARTGGQPPITLIIVGLIVLTFRRRTAQSTDLVAKSSPAQGRFAVTAQSNPLSILAASKIAPPVMTTMQLATASPVHSRSARTASSSLSLEDTSPPWNADAARPECGHYWRRPRGSEPPGHGGHRGPMCRAAENHSRNPS